MSYHTRRVLDLHAFLGHFDDIRHVGSRGDREQYEARCPAHETNHRSLAIAKTRDGMILVHCHGGCEVEDVLSAVGLSLQDLYPDGCVESGRCSSATIGRRMNVNHLGKVIDTWMATGKIVDRSVWAKWANAIVTIAKADVEAGCRTDTRLARKVAQALKDIHP